MPASGCRQTPASPGLQPKPALSEDIVADRLCGPIPATRPDPNCAYAATSSAAESAFRWQIQPTVGARQALPAAYREAQAGHPDGNERLDAFAAAAQDRPMNRVFHALREYYLGALPLLHWLVLLLAAGAVAVGLAWIAAPRVWALPLGAAALGLWILNERARRRLYVSFQPGADAPAPAPLAASHAVAVRATGVFEVENRCQAHTWLEGYYRTFPSREHAVIASLAPHRVLRWIRRRPQCQGMWYIFCLPQAVRRVQVGRIRFGRQVLPGVALTHWMQRPGRVRRNRRVWQASIVYLGCQDDAEARLIAGDLLHDAVQLSA